MATITESNPQSNLDMPKRGMPVTIITGFLGSGKTTLLNHILTNNQDLKVAVLVNEFGDINIDSQLIVASDEDMVELSNGCICCTINEGLLEAVYNILERSDRIDYLVVETTGIADPLPVALTFLGTELQHFTRLDSILTVIDAENFTPEHFESEAAYSQMMYGDVILLNKTDLVTEEKLTELEDYIRTSKSGARILRSQQGQVPLPLILDINLANPALKPEPATEHNHDHHHDHDHSTCDRPDHDHSHDHGHEHHDRSSHDHSHDHSDHMANDGFISISFTSDRPFDLDKFQHFLDKQLPVEVYRAKGILWFDGVPSRYVFQLSGKRYELKIDDRAKPLNNQLVLIGRNLNQPELLEQMNACLR